MGRSDHVGVDVNFFFPWGKRFRNGMCATHPKTKRCLKPLESIFVVRYMGWMTGGSKQVHFVRRGCVLCFAFTVHNCTLWLITMLLHFFHLEESFLNILVYKRSHGNRKGWVLTERFAKFLVRGSSASHFCNAFCTAVWKTKFWNISRTDRLMTFWITNSNLLLLHLMLTAQHYEASHLLCKILQFKKWHCRS